MVGNDGSGMGILIRSPSFSRNLLSFFWKTREFTVLVFVEKTSGDGGEEVCP